MSVAGVRGRTFPQGISLPCTWLFFFFRTITGMRDLQVRRRTEAISATLYFILKWVRFGEPVICSILIHQWWITFGLFPRTRLKLGNSLSNFAKTRIVKIFRIFFLWSTLFSMHLSMHASRINSSFNYFFIISITIHSRLWVRCPCVMVLTWSQGCKRPPEQSDFLGVWELVSWNLRS